MNILPFIKRAGDFQTGDYVAPLTRFPKYPITQELLEARISKLGSKYNIPLDLKSYRMNPQGIELIKSEMKGKGGIYIWYCHITGFFYLGSAQVFFGKGARLSTYLVPSRLSEDVRYVSRDLAADLLKYGHASFSVIIVERFDVGMDVSMLLYQEQLWMLLYPTYNRSLKVGSNEGQPMPESKRREKSTVVYSYEVVNGCIIPESEQLHYGKKHLIREGLTTMDGQKINISNFDLSPLIKTGGLYMARFLFTTTKLVEDSLVNWKPPVSDSGLRVKGVDTRTSGVFVYKYMGSNHVYTDQDLVKFYSEVTTCREHYKISKTHFQRLRKYMTPHNNLVFSNNQLH